MLAAGCCDRAVGASYAARAICIRDRRLCSCHHHRRRGGWSESGVDAAPDCTPALLLQSGLVLVEEVLESGVSLAAFVVEAEDVLFFTPLS